VKVYTFIKAHKSEFSISVMCRVLEVSRSGYYTFIKRPKSAREQSNTRVIVHMKAIHSKKYYNYYGSPRMCEELRDRGLHCSENRVARLMRQAGIVAKPSRRFKCTTQSKHNFPIHPNRLNQRFDVEAPNQVWVSDITYIKTGEGWLYLATVEDLFSRKIVGWALQPYLSSDLVLQAFKMACWKRRPPKGVIHHSDRGSQYASGDFQKALAQHGFVPSMSRKGNCYDNAVMESFFHTLKAEEVNDCEYFTRLQAKQAITEYITFYNQYLLHSYLGYHSPNNFELLKLA
jgi:putative transposase